MKEKSYFFIFIIALCFQMWRRSEKNTFSSNQQLRYALVFLAIPEK